MSRRIFRYEVPVDDREHSFDLAGSPLSVSSRKSGVVEFWAWGWDKEDHVPTVTRRFRVVGTGHEVSPNDGVKYWGTTQDGGTQWLIWHLIEEG